MASTLSRFFYSIDLLSLPPQLKVNQQNSYKTLLGGLTSLLLILLTIASVGYFGKDLISKKDPTTIVSAYDYQDLRFNVGIDGYYLFMAIEDSNFNYYNDPSIFTFSAYHKNVTLNNQGVANLIEKEIEIKPCKTFFKDTDKLKDGLNRDLFYCLKPDEISIQGYWGNKINAYAGIYLKKCVNSTENNNFCKPIEEIDEKINGGVISMYSTNYLLDLKDFDSPAKLNFNNIFYSLNTDFTFTLFIQLRKIEIYTDAGFIFEDISMISKFYVDTPHLLYYGKRNEIIADIVIQNKPMGNLIKRNYIKFQDFLTKIGGLIKALMVIGGIIIQFTSEIQFFNDYIYNINLRKSLINIQGADVSIKQEKEEKKLDDFSSKSKPSINNLVKESYFSSNLKPVKSSHLNKSPIQIRLKSFNKTINVTNLKYSLKTSTLDFIIQACCCNKSNLLKQMKKNIVSKFNQALSIEILLEKIYMVEALSSFVFSEDQLLNTYNHFTERILDNKENNDSMNIFKIKKSLLA